MSGRVADSTGRRLALQVARDQARGRLPSLVAGAVRDGDLVWTGSVGVLHDRVADGGRPGPAPDIDTAYRIGSITKTMTALLVMQLRDEGALRLTERLDAYLPASAYGDRTLLSLLSHAGGLQAEPPGDWWERSPGVSAAELQARLSGATGAFPEARRYHYSNVGFALLGELVATMRGCSWEQALQRHLLAPLGLTATGVRPTAPVANGFSVDPFAHTLADQPAHDTGAMAPAGQVWSTVRDLARYAAFLADPDASVVDPASVAEMTVVRSGDPDDVVESAYGLGLRLAVEGGRTYVGHTGSMPGYLAGLFVDRAAKTAAVCLANATSGLRCQGLPIDLMATLESAEPAFPSPWEPAGEPPPQVRALLGLWFWGSTGFVASATPDGFALTALGGTVPWCTFRAEPDGLVGTTGYLLAERLQVTRWSEAAAAAGADAERVADRLECATFAFTRQPR